MPDFTFAGWKNQAPWCTLSASLGREDRRNHWESRRDQLFFSGSLANGRWRRRLRKLCDELWRNNSNDLNFLDVRDVTSDFFHWDRRGSVVGMDHPRRKSTAGIAHAPATPLPIDAPCRYRYALSIPGYGYSSRLRALLACGCAVIHVRSPWNEFFSPVLRHGVHLFEVQHVRHSDLRTCERQSYRRIPHATEM